MWLAVDSGNTRIKWAVMHGTHITASGAAPKRRFALPLQVAAAEVDAVWVAHTGTAADWQHLQRALGKAKHRPQRITPRHRACGVVNPYQPPAQLGADRWLCHLAAAALPAVRARGAVVVSAGTALTIDLVRADGKFVGGWILPGLAASTAALARHTPLPAVAVEDAPSTATTAPPCSTADAIAHGALFAAAAAVQRARRQHAPAACILLTGGDAPLLHAHLPRARHLPHLLFAGMARLYIGGKAHD